MFLFLRRIKWQRCSRVHWPIVTDSATAGNTTVHKSEPESYQCTSVLQREKVGAFVCVCREPNL